MTAPLDEKGLEAARDAVRLNPTDIETAIRAYLAASPSQSMEMVVAWEHKLTGIVRQKHDQPSASSLAEGDYEKLVRASQAQAALADMREKLAIAERNRDAGRDNFHTMQQSAADLAAQVLRLTEENEALRKERTSLIETKREQIERLEISRGAASKVALEAIARAEAAEARIKALEEAQEPALEHIEGLLELLKVIKDHWIDYDHVFSIAVHEAEDFLARSDLKENAL